MALLLGGKNKKRTDTHPDEDTWCIRIQRMYRPRLSPPAERAPHTEWKIEAWRRRELGRICNDDWAGRCHFIIDLCPKTETALEQYTELYAFTMGGWVVL